MAIPPPVPGLVIRYGYLWRHEALRGREGGAKDRPAVVVLAVQAIGGESIVTVAPVTHSPPARPRFAVEIPAATRRRLGLDDDHAWIVAADLNRFVWPGPDLRPTPGDPCRFDYGLLPTALFRDVRDRIIALARTGKLHTIPRSE